MWFTATSSFGRYNDPMTFPPPPSASYNDVASDASGNVWVTDSINNLVLKALPGGGTVGYPITTRTPGPTEIIRGPDGAMWFVEANVNKIGRIDSAGNIEEFPLGDGSDPVGITVGPDNNIWFTEYTRQKIAKLDLNPPTGGGSGGAAPPPVAPPGTFDYDITAVDGISSSEATPRGKINIGAGGPTVTYRFEMEGLESNDGGGFSKCGELTSAGSHAIGERFQHLAPDSRYRAKLRAVPAALTPSVCI